jgi:DNA-binding XRE family transcriptional regulator
MLPIKFFHEEQVKELQLIIREVLQSELSRFQPYFKKMLEEEKNAAFVDQKTLCNELLVTRQTVSNWEKGNVKGMSIIGLFEKKGSRKLYNLKAIKEKFEKK